MKRAPANDVLFDSPMSAQMQVEAVPGGLPQGVRVQVPGEVLEKLLASIPVLAGCPPEAIRAALPSVLAFEADTGATLLSSRGAAVGLGVLLAGAARTFAGDTYEEDEPFEQLQPPDFFGEVGLLTGGDAGYAVEATEPTRLMWLPASAAKTLLAAAPHLMSGLAQRLALRFQRLCRPAPPMLTVSAEELTPAPDAPQVIPFAQVGDFDVQPSVLTLLPARVIRLHQVLPLRVAEQRLTLGMVNPRNVAALSEVQRTLPSLTLEIVAIASEDFAQSVARLKIDEPRSAKGERERPRLNPDSLVFETAENDAPDRGPPPKMVGEEVSRVVARIVASALDRDASDIHMEPTSSGLRVRFRVNGTLQDWSEQVPPSLAKGVVARVKVVGGLDITERRRPQDGRIGLRAGKRDVDLRVSSLPSSRGEKIVMRVLDSATGTRPLGQLFVDDRVLAMARRALNRPWGGIVIAGSTGSGKTSTLYAMLNERRATRPDTHIVMVEDPIEYRLDGVTQVQVDHGAELGFSQVLRSMLRQDPDVIVVGEMRDSETARIGLEGAMTGHVLLTSLHANEALGVVQRLEQLGCGRPLLSQALSLVLVQRLVRRLCSSCHTTAQVPQAIIDSLVARKVLAAGASGELPQPVGCDACHRTGYVGRLAVVEALQLTDDVRHLLAAGESLARVYDAAVKGDAIVTFASTASKLLNGGLITAADALLVVAE